MADIYSTITHHGLEALGRFYSVYRGIVVNNEDPENLNRLRVAIPGIMGGIILWALPRGQHGGEGNGFKFMAPKVEDVVYITFEGGDPSKPLWEYHGWSVGQIPSVLEKPSTLGLVTPKGTMVYIDDEDGSLNILTQGRINILSRDPLSVHSDKEIHLETPEKVIINNGNNKGIIKIQELTNKLNQLVAEIEELKNSYNAHTHPSLGAPTATPLVKSLTKFNKQDYENPKLVH